VFGPRAKFWASNVDGTQNVLDAARAAGCKRVVHVSTEAVLIGGPQLINADESWPLPKHPLGLYPETKGEAERRVLAANRDGLETVIVRPRFIWGADNPVLTRIAQAVHDGKFAWIGGGRHLTSTCHVRNVCEGALAAAERGRPGGVYFLTDGAPIEFRRFMTEMLATQGVTPGDRAVPRWLAYAAGAMIEVIWRLFRIQSEPSLVRTVVPLIGAEVTVRDDLARREIGYAGAMSREAGLDELRSPATSASK
jgi:nucleoside-diphosphate-sugar epimerase